MSGVLLFVPDVRTESEAQRKLLALDMASIECDSLRMVLENGPNGGLGAVGLIGSGQPAVREDQRWERSADEAVYFAIDGSCSPGDLMRATVHDGANVTLLDGNVWSVPIPRHMPSKYTLDKDGNPVSQLRAPYQAFFEKTLNMVARLQDDPPSIREWFDYGCEALGWNYRIERRMVAFLGLFDNDAVLQILLATCENGEALKILTQKKTAE